MFGAVGGMFYSLIASISAMGALNANVFATARLCVAAGKRSYFPPIFANLHSHPGEEEHEYYERKLRIAPTFIRNLMVIFGRYTAHLRLVEEVPV